MRQAITTKYLGPTNFRGSRIKAVCDALTITVSWDHRLDVQANHAQAAEILASRLGWYGKWFGGGMSKGGYCFVWAWPGEPTFTIKIKKVKS